MNPIRVMFATAMLGLLLVGLATVIQGAAGIGLAGGGVKAARAVSPDEAAKLDGTLVAVRGMPELAEPLAVAGFVGDRPILYYRHVIQRTELVNDETGKERKKRTQRNEAKRWAGSFRVGPIEVDPKEARPEQLRQLGQITGENERIDIYRGIWADEEVTVIGTVSGGKIVGGAPFVISPRPRAELAEVLDEGGGRLFIIAGLLVTLLGLIGLIGLAAVGTLKRI